MPIYRLPDELLSRIFFPSFQAPSRRLLSQLQGLAQVPAQWAQLVKGSPFLFGYVTSDNTLKRHQIMLRLSRYAPLDTHYAGSGAGSQDYLSTLIMQAQRWRTLELVQVRSENLKCIFSQPTPQLQDIHISGSRMRACKVELPPEKLCQLKHLMLEKVSVQWNYRLLRGLKTLELSCIGPEGLLNTSQLLDILRQSPELVTLRSGSDVVTSTGPQTYTPFNLHFLTNFSNMDIGVSITRDLIAMHTHPQMH